MEKLVLNLAISAVTLALLLWACVVHLSSLQSKGILKIAGYAVLIFHFIGELQEIGPITFSPLILGLWCIACGEILWYYQKEKAFSKLLELRSNDSLYRYYFADFQSLPMNEDVDRSGGRSVRKIFDQGDCIKLEAEYQRETVFTVESMDYDYSLLLKDGFIDMEILGRKFALLQPGERREVKAGTPIKMYIHDKSNVLITLNKR